METVFERVRRVICGIVDVDESAVVPQASLIDDLGADSLDLVNITMAIEEEFSDAERTLRIPEESMEQVRTVRQILDLLAGEGFTDATVS